MRLETEQLAWFVLRVVNDTQTKSSTVRLAVPSDPEAVAQLPMSVSEGELSLAEEYLKGHGHLALADITLSRGTYTITPTGLDWLESGSPQQTEFAAILAEDRRTAEPYPAADGTREGARGEARPWWRRVFGKGGR